ncbi:hypothetical protein ASE55_09200 [Chryseobacterium sp. Leaf201]|nr:hypothetical protein ASE55_09200 [Chryseobacterium sp. Leaf201]
MEVFNGETLIHFSSVLKRRSKKSKARKPVLNLILKFLMLHFSRIRLARKLLYLSDKIKAT